MAFSGSIRTQEHLMASIEPAYMELAMAGGPDVAETTRPSMGRFERAKLFGRKTVALAGVMLMVGGAIKGANSLNTDPAKADVSPAALDHNYENDNCQDVSFESPDPTSNPDEFSAQAALPRLGDKDAQEYVSDSLFGADGAALKSKQSLATLSMISDSFLKKNVNDPNFSYIDSYTSFLGSFKSESQAAIACDNSYATIYQLAEDNDSWARPGDHVSKLKFNRDGSYKIVDAELTKPQVVQEMLGGIEISARDTYDEVDGREIQGAPSALITKDGDVYFKGLNPSDAGSTDKDKKHKGKGGNNKNDNKKGNGGGKSADDKQSSGNNEGSQFGDDTSTGETGNGVVPENQGQAPGPGEDQGGDTGSDNGTLPSPGGGGGVAVAKHHQLQLLLHQPQPLLLHLLLHQPQPLLPHLLLHHPHLQ